MKTMFFKVRGLLAFMLVMLLISHVSFAQQTTSTGPGTFKTVKEVNYPAGTNDPTSIKKTENGNALNTVTGDVTVITANEKGETVQTVYSKPSANIQIGFAEAFAQYREQFDVWMKYNPDYTNYLTAEEVSMIESNQLEAMFKQKYFSSLNSQPYKKVSNN